MERVSLEAESTHEAAPGVHLALMAGTESMNVQHFAIESNATVETHSHPHEQTGFIYEGELVFITDGEEIRCCPGDAYGIPGGQPHAAENRGSVTVRGVDIFSPPRTNPSWKTE